MKVTILLTDDDHGLYAIQNLETKEFIAKGFHSEKKARTYAKANGLEVISDEQLYICSNAKSCTHDCECKTPHEPLEVDDNILCTTYADCFYTHVTCCCKPVGSVVPEAPLTVKEEQIVKATIFLHKVNVENDGFIPDYNLFGRGHPFILTVEQMRAIRDVVQEVATEK